MESVPGGIVGRKRVEALPFEPGEHDLDRPAEQPRQRVRGQPAKIPRNLPRAGDGLDDEPTVRGHEVRHPVEETRSIGPSEAQRVPERDHRVEPLGMKGRT